MKKTVFILGCLSLLFFTACQKETSDNFTTYTGNPLNDTVWLKNVTATASVNELLNSFLPNVIVDSFDISKSDTTLTYGDSLSISFSAGSCIGSSSNGGSPGVPSGKIKLQLLRLKTKGDYLKTFKATTSNGYLLEAAGGFFISVTKDGKDLALAPGATVKIRFSDTEVPKTNMQVFYGKETFPLPASGVIDTSYTWVRDADTSWLKIFQKQSGINSSAIVTGYELVSKNLRWVAAERYIDSTQAKTKITAVLPPNFTNKNTAVFAVFANQKTVVYLGPDYPSRSFAANNIPIGAKIKLVSVSKIGDGFYLGTKDINDVGRVTYYPVAPEKESLQQIISFINSL